MRAIDVRPAFVTIPGQEVLSADGVTLKVSVAAQYEVADLDIAFNKTADATAALYLTLQMALREIVGQAKIDELLENRARFAEGLVAIAAEPVAALGLRLLAADIKDIMFPGELKRIFAQVVQAKQEGLAALEKARGETAALRNPANAARAVQDNPALLQLRMLQAVAGAPGSTLVVGVPGALPVARRANASLRQRPSERGRGREGRLLDPTRASVSGARAIHHGRPFNPGGGGMNPRTSTGEEKQAFPVESIEPALEAIAGVLARHLAEALKPLIASHVQPSVHVAEEDELPALLKVEEAAKILRIGRDTAYELVRRHEIPSISLGRRIVIPTAKLLELIHSGTVGSA